MEKAGKTCVRFKERQITAAEKTWYQPLLGKTMWSTSMYRCAAKEQQRDRGLREPREEESWKSVDQKGGPAACSKGMACEALGRPKKGDRQATRTAALTAGLLA